MTVAVYELNGEIEKGYFGVLSRKEVLLQEPPQSDDTEIQCSVLGPR